MTFELGSAVRRFMVWDGSAFVPDSGRYPEPELIQVDSMSRERGGRPRKAKAMDRSRRAAARAVQDRIAENDALVWPALSRYRDQGFGYLRCAQALNRDELPSSTGKVGKWTAMMVKRMCDRRELR